MNRTVIYLRVSTDRQKDKNQLVQLKKMAQAQGWPIEKIYQEDGGISGSKGRAQRPALDAMMKDAARRKFDRLLVWSVDRLGRSVQEVAMIMSDLDKAGVVQFFHVQGIDSSTVYGKAMVQMALVFAELELGIIRDRIHAGLARARAEGKRLGKAPLCDKRRQAVIDIHKENPDDSIRTIARKSGVSPSKVHEIISTMKKAS